MVLATVVAAVVVGATVIVPVVVVATVVVPVVVVVIIAVSVVVVATVVVPVVVVATVVVPVVVVATVVVATIIVPIVVDVVLLMMVLRASRTDCVITAPTIDTIRIPVKTLHNVDEKNPFAADITELVLFLKGIVRMTCRKKQHPHIHLCLTAKS